MTRELKCPKCGEVFEVDEAGYAAILSQVKNAEFEEELSKREANLKSQLKEVQKAQLELAKKEYDKELYDVKNKLSQKQTEIDNLKMLQLSEINRLKSENQKDVQIAEDNAKNDMKDQLNAKDISISKMQAEIARLKDKIGQLNSDKQKEVQLAEGNVKNDMKDQLNAKDISISKMQAEITRLKDQIGQLNSDKQKEVQLAVTKTQNEQMEQLNKKDQEIIRLRGQVEQANDKAQLELSNMKNGYERQLKDKDATIEFYKDLKIKLSTKMLGETLEDHCNIAFNKVRAQAYPNAYFEKDNDDKKGTKGDFIFRDYGTKGDKNTEYISIMFEMKNEADKTATKHKNEDFFAKLDKDRNDKNCEYAVLVSTLEQDSEIYNEGIVDVSHLYPKMFVVRPQFFMSIIGLLTSTSRNSIALRQQLAIARKQDIDVTNFETKLSEFKDGFYKNFKWAAGHFNEAVKKIDETIKSLTIVKQELLSSVKQLDNANKKADKLTIKSLTYNNPTMKKKFEEAKKVAENIKTLAEEVDDMQEEVEIIEEGDFGNIPEVEEEDNVKGAEHFLS